MVIGPLLVFMCHSYRWPLSNVTFGGCGSDVRQLPSFFAGPLALMKSSMAMIAGSWAVTLSSLGFSPWALSFGAVSFCGALGGSGFFSAWAKAGTASNRQNGISRILWFMGSLDDDRCFGDLQGFFRRAAARAGGLERLHGFHAGHDLAEDRVVVVEVRRRHEGQEELRAVGAGAGVGHRQQARLVVPGLGIELAVVVVARTAGAAAERAAASRHEALDHAVELEAVVEAELRQVDRARHVHRRHLRQQLDLDLALVGVELPEVALAVEREPRRLRQAGLPAVALAVDLAGGDEVVDLRDRRLGRAGCSGLG